jgi:NADH:ubiquinone oxidoreductase subunit 2 (subunit N)
VLFSGLGSIILGCFIALRARRVHAFIAGSGINHMGFILCGVGCQSNLGFTSALFYLITYVITSSAFFLLLTIIKNKCGKSITYIRDLYQVQNDPFIQGALFVILFSFAGIPPLVGFFSKALILFALYNKGYTLLCFIIVITALISTYYYLRLICFSSFKQNYIGIRSRTKKLCAVPRYENKPVVFEFGPYNYLATLSIHNKIVDLKDQFNKKIKPYFFVLFRSDNTKKKDHYLLFSLLFYILIFIPFHGAV